MKIKSSPGLGDDQAEQIQLTAREQDVRKHLENVDAKLGVSARTGAVARFFGAAGAVLGLIVTLAACGASTSTKPLGPGREQLNAGVHALDLVARINPNATNGLAQLPTIELTLPAGWSNYDGWAMHKGHTPDTVFVTFWDVDQVYPVPCRWQFKPMVDPGRSVEGLASALAKQPLRKATASREITLGGFGGKYLEWSVPAGIDFSDCDEGSFESWTARGWAGDRYQQAPGQVDRIWILDVNGERLVVDASYLPRATEEDRAELERVVDSIRFLK